MNHLQRGFTIIELVVVMLILAYFRQQNDKAENGLAHR